MHALARMLMYVLSVIMYFCMARRTIMQVLFTILLFVPQTNFDSVLPLGIVPNYLIGCCLRAVLFIVKKSKEE